VSNKAKVQSRAPGAYSKKSKRRGGHIHRIIYRNAIIAEGRSAPLAWKKALNVVGRI
jgi:hypothetical protein